MRSMEKQGHDVKTVKIVQAESITGRGTGSGGGCGCCIAFTSESPSMQSCMT